MVNSCKVRFVFYLIFWVGSFQWFGFVSSVTPFERTDSWQNAHAQVKLMSSDCRSELWDRNSQTWRPVR